MARGRTGRVRVALAVGALAGATAVPGAAAARDDDGLPTSMAALGDSISRGFNACGFYVDCTRRSWSTGDDRGVDSHRLRLRELGAQPDQHNLARDGARVSSLAAQAADAVAAGADYVTIEIGANDACRSSEAKMTPPAEFAADVAKGLGVLEAGLPDARVFVASIPDVVRLWETAHHSRAARFTWNKLNVCQSLLAHPNSTSAKDAARRDRVRERVRAYNAALEAACAAYAGECGWDGGAVYATKFSLDEVSRWDWFHPNAEGQRLLAAVTWKAGFQW